MNFWPLASVTLPSLNLPTRIFGPCRSHMMPTVRPVLREISFTSAARARWSSAVPCEKFSRTTSTPERTMPSSTPGALGAGASVATFFVLRSICPSVSSCYDRIGRWRRAARRLLVRHLVQDLQRVSRHLRQAVSGGGRREVRLAGREDDSALV